MIEMVEHRSRGFVEVLVEARILARAEPPKRLDGGADGREWILHLVGDASRDFSPGRDPARRRQGAAAGPRAAGSR